MKCVTHNNLDAVSTCNDCGVGLCTECTSQFEAPICLKCNMARGNLENRSWWRNLALTCAAFIIGLLAAQGVAEGQLNFGMTLIFAYAMAGIPFGWAALSRITPNVFLTLPLAGWGVYFLIKLMLAYWVGIVALPFNLLKLVRDRQRIKSLTNGIHAVDSSEGPI